MGWLPPIPEGMTPTMDPWVVIEEQRPGYVRYCSLDDGGRRWEVWGTCAWTDPNRHGPCMEGAACDPIGPPEGRLDCPITPELDCWLCVGQGHMRFVDLAPATWPADAHRRFLRAANVRLSEATKP